MKTLFSLICTFSIFSVVFATSLSDIANTPYQTSIESILNQGIVSGYPDGTFKPEQKINRAEFTKIVMNAFKADELLETTESCFSDVKASEWYGKFVCNGKRKNIVGGYNDGKFKPENNVNFAEASKIILLSAELTLRASQANEEWFLRFTEKMDELNARPSNVNNDQEITRGEMAYIIDKIISAQTGLNTANIPEPADKDVSKKYELTPEEQEQLRTTGDVSGIGVSKKQVIRKLQIDDQDALNTTGDSAAYMH